MARRWSDESAATGALAAGSGKQRTAVNFDAGATRLILAARSACRPLPREASHGVRRAWSGASGIAS